MFFGNINYGIDMTGGTQSEFSYTGDIEITKLNEQISEISKEFNTTHNNIINGVSLY
jgi:preprotein translocase subunit SecF